MRMNYIAFFLCFLLLCGCSTIDKYSVESVGLKIAVLADTQITTDKLIGNFGYRSVTADKFVDVSIRTPAQEYLADDILLYMLDDVRDEKVDFALYLGDGVNSGCKDEVDVFFKTLILARDSDSKKRLPIFVVIGNHDYLATGNQTDEYIRKRTCGKSNDFLTKSDFIKKLAIFNRNSMVALKSNSSLMGNSHSSFYYVDNVNLAENVTPNSNKLPFQYLCDEVRPETQHSEGCFYSAVIGYKKNKIKGEILLTDTSDYESIKVHPRLQNQEVYGVRGSISWGEESQIDWFTKTLEQRNAKTSNVRVIASHYPMKALNWTGLYSGQNGNILLEGYGKNLWLSAHSHEKELNTGYIKTKIGPRFKKAIAFAQEFNIGSTTDYIPRYAIIDKKKNHIERTSRPLKKTPKEALKLSFCENRIAEMTLINSISPLPDSQIKQDNFLMLGLTKAYREDNFKVQNVKANLDNFFLDRDENENLELDKKCMMLIASKNESL